jgi:hypothetical protein
MLVGRDFEPPRRPRKMEDPRSLPTGSDREMWLSWEQGSWTNLMTLAWTCEGKRGHVLWCAYQSVCRRTTNLKVSTMPLVLGSIQIGYKEINESMYFLGSGSTEIRRISIKPARFPFHQSEEITSTLFYLPRLILDLAPSRFRFYEVVANWRTLRVLLVPFPTQDWNSHSCIS